MRKVFLLVCCVAAMFPIMGCSESREATVATTDESEMAAYEAMINEGEGEGEEEVSEAE